MIKTFKEIGNYLREQNNDYSHLCEYRRRTDFKRFCNPKVIGKTNENRGNMRSYRYVFRKEDWDRFLEYTVKYSWGQYD